MEIWEGDTGDWTQSLSHFVLASAPSLGSIPTSFCFTSLYSEFCLPSFLPLAGFELCSLGGPWTLKSSNFNLPDSYNYKHVPQGSTSVGDF